MFQFRRFPSHTYAFSMGYHDMTHGGLLHSVTPGSLPAYGSPRHFAVSRDLLRLPMPRHSLCALCSLTLLYACFSNFFELLEIAVFYPNFFEYLTLISSLLFFHCSVFKIPCSNATAFERQYHRCRTSSFLPLRGTAMNCFLPSRSVRRGLTAGSTRWWAQISSHSPLDGLYVPF